MLTDTFEKNKQIIQEFGPNLIQQMRIGRDKINSIFCPLLKPLEEVWQARFFEYSTTIYIETNHKTKIGTY